MKQSLLLFYLFFPFFVFAQITLTTQSFPATCTANGVLEITAQGGVAPYSYQIIGAPLGLTRPLQASNRFEALSGGVYTVQVTDITNATATASASVVGLYTLPSLPSAVVQNATVVITAHNGRAPFRYAYAAVGDTNYWTNGHLTSNNVFECVPNGDYIFRTYDACGNYFPIGVTVDANGSLPPAICNPNVDGTTNISYYFPSNAIPPYTFTATSNTGIITTNTTGSFANLSGCTFSVVYTDKCGRTYPAQSYNCVAPQPLCGKASCFNGKNGTATISAIGGRAPYTFSALENGVVITSNTTGIFTNLSPNNVKNFEITDNCGQRTWLNIIGHNEQFVEFKCPYNDTIEVSFNQNYTVYSPCDTVTRAVFPINLSVYNTANAVIYTHTYNSSTDVAIHNLVAPVTSGYYAVFSNSCGRVDTALLRIKSQHDARLGCFDWDAGTADLHAYNGLAPYTYIALDAQIPFNINTTGIFNNIDPGLSEYKFYVLDQCADSLLIKVRHHTMFAKYNCPFNDTVYLRTNDPFFYTYINRDEHYHPYGYPLTMNYYHDGNLLNTQTISDSSIREVKFGIVPFPNSTTYIEIFTACGGRDVIIPSTTKLRIHIAASCDTLRCFFLNGANGATPEYSLYHNNVLIAQNNSGIFSHIRDAGQYFIDATLNGGCLTRDSITIDSLVKPAFQIGVYSKPTAGVCKQVYQVRTSNGEITLANITGTVIGVRNNFVGLQPGDYLYKRTGCTYDTLHLPALNWNLTGVTNMHLNCNGTVNFVLNGANQIPYYLQNISNIFGTNANVVNLNFRDYYGVLGLNGNGGNTFANIPMGTTYHAVLTPHTAYYPASQNCPLDTLTFTTPIYSRPTLTATSSVLCGGSTSGSITATALNGTPVYRFQLLNPPAGYALPTTLSSSSNSVTFLGLPQGSYHFLMEDSCHISADFDATVGVYGFTPSFERFCNGDVRLSLPDISNASFVWQNASGGTIGTNHEVRFFNLAAGNYFVTVTTNNGCTFTHTIAVPAAACPPVLAVAGANQVGLSNNFTLAANPATNGATGVWTQLGGLAQAIFTNANNPTTTVNLPTPGTYALVWTIDGGTCGCISSDTVLVTQCVITDSLRATLNPTPPACNSTGAQIAIVPDASANPASWQYTWSYNNLHSSTISGLPAGTYTVTITDGRPCALPLILSVTVNNFSNTQINSMVSCNGGRNGSATVFVLGGIPPYTYQWNIAPPMAVGNSINNVTAGVYTVSITDATNCTTVRNITITEPLGMVLQLSQQPTFCYHSCNGGVRVDTIIGGAPPYNYSWSNGYVLRSFNNQCAGVYTVTVTDINGCTKSASIIITQPDTLLINLTAITPANCTNADGGANVVATGGNGGYIYYWDNTNPAATATNLTSGMHSVLVRDAKGCERRDSILINASPAILATITSASIEESKCVGSCTGKITLTTITNGVAPYHFLWSNGDTQITADSLCANNLYTVTVSDAVGCTATAFANMTEIPALIMGTPQVRNVNCYQESNGRVETGNSGGTPPYHYLWSNGRQNDSLLNIRAGIYTITVTDMNNCAISRIITVTEPPELTAHIENLNPILCNGERTGDLTAIVAGGSPDYLYRYNTQAFASVVPNLAGIGGGNYTVTVTDSHNCSIITSFRVDDPLPIILTFPTVRDAGCYGAVSGFIIANTVGGTGNPRFYHYDWSVPSSNNDTLRNILGGTYTATVTDANGCKQTLSATIATKTAPVIDSVHLHQPVCNGYSDGSIKIFVSQGIPPYTYRWNPNPQASVIDSIWLVRSGYYYVTVTDAVGCFHTNRFALMQPFPIVANVTALPPICYDTPTGTIIISAVQNTQPLGSEVFSIGSLIFDTAHIYTNLAPNEYLVTIKDSTGCVLQKTVYISSGLPFTVDIGGDQVINLGDTLYLKARLNTFSAVQYEWQILDYKKNILQITNGSDVTRYFKTLITERVLLNSGGYAVVIATDSFGCVAIDTMRFFLKDRYDIYIPNIFTPNNDGVNDLFTAYGGASAKEIALMRVFDRWGELIYENTNLPLGSTRSREAWDGTFKDQLLNNSVFSYYIEIDFIDHTHQIFVGDVTLKR